MTKNKFIKDLTYDRSSNVTPNLSDCTIIDLFYNGLQATPNSDLFTFYTFADGTSHLQPLSWNEVDIQVNQVANLLRKVANRGDRVVVLFDHGPDFVVSLLACFTLGLVAVPVYPPTNNRYLKTYMKIVEDCSPKYILTNKKTQTRLKLPQDVLATMLIVNDVGSVTNLESSPTLVPVVPTDIAYLQYTSGSTGNPKGVIITHANILANTQALGEFCRFSGGDKIFSWLPLYHDMGLIGGVFQPIVSGVPSVLSAPALFVRNPLIWLEIIDQEHITHTGGPHFAFRSVLNAWSSASVVDFDLSRLKVIFNGSEPIDNSTCDAFERALMPHRLSSKVIAPCYGLAEATLFVTADRYCSDINTGNDNPSCGTPASFHQVWIADQHSTQSLGENQPGEVIVSGPSVAKGYWGDPIKTAKYFFNQQGESCLRTGDIGVIKGGRLSILSRIKDLIIVNGRNIYPHDIETAVMGLCHTEIKGQLVACVCSRSNRPVVICEVARRHYKSKSLRDIAADIQRVTFSTSAVVPESVLLVKVGMISRAANGKVRRAKTAHLYHLHKLNALITQEANVSAKTKQSMTDRPINVYSSGSHTITTCSRSIERANIVIDWLSKYARTRLNSRQMRERRTIPANVILDFANRGIMGLQAPLPLGGLDLTHVDALRLQSHLASIDPTLAAFVGLHNVLALRLVLRHSEGSQAKLYEEMLASGRMLGAFALTESSSGSAPSSITTVARFTEGGYRLSGRKRWIGNAAWAGLLVVIAKVVDSDPCGMTAFLVENDSDGLSMGAESLTVGVNAMIQNDVYLVDVFVANANILGRVGEGLQIAQDAMMAGRLGIGAIATGAMRRGLHLAYTFTENRMIGPHRLGDMAATRHQQQVMSSNILVLDAAIDNIAQRLDANKKVCDEYYAAIKLVASEWSYEAIDSTIQMSGARGYMESNPLAQLMCDIRLLRIFEGTSETIADFLGGRVISRSLSAEVVTFALLAPDDRNDQLNAKLNSLFDILRLASTKNKAVGRIGAIERQLAGRCLAIAIVANLATELLLTKIDSPLIDAIYQDLHRHIDQIQARWAPSGGAQVHKLRGKALLGIDDLRQTAPAPNIVPNMTYAPTRLSDISSTPPDNSDRESSDFVVSSNQEPQPSQELKIVTSEAALFFNDWLIKMAGKPIDKSLSFDSLGVDSIHILELTFELENKYGVTLNEDDFFYSTTINQFEQKLNSISSSHV